MPDMMIGWNIEYDFDYLLNRTKKLSLPLDFDGLERFDLMIGYTKYHKISRYPKLKRIALKEKLTTKDEAYKGAKVKEMFENAPEELVKYNMKDVWYTVQIDKKYYWISDYFRRLKDMVGIEHIEKGFAGSVLIDTDMIRDARKEGLILRSMTSKDEEIFKGALVLEQEHKGLSENVSVFDMSRYYPNIIISFNLSPDNHRLFPKVCRKYILLRDKVEEKLEHLVPGTDEYEIVEKEKEAIKTLTEIIYGYLSSRYNRFHTKSVGGEVTRYGREGLLHMKQEFENLGFTVLYGDSVVKDTKIRTKSGQIEIEKLWNLVPSTIFKDKFDKERKHCQIPVLTCDTTNGKTKFSNAIEIIRHKVNKKIYRIWLTNMDYIDVTEDHSIFSTKPRPCTETPIEIELVKPTNVHSLLSPRYIPSYPVRTKGFSLELMSFFGYWIGDGSYDNTPYYIYQSLGIDSEELKKKLLQPMVLEKWCKGYSIGPNGDSCISSKELKKLMKEMGFVGTSATKKIPDWIFQETGENKCALLKGMFSADGSTAVDGQPGYGSINRKLVEQAKELLMSVGIACGLKMDKGGNQYKGKFSGTFGYNVMILDKQKFRDKIGFLQDRKNNRIRDYVQKRFYGDLRIRYPTKIEHIEYDDYVYDVCVPETQCFFANDILVHNTDGLQVDVPFEEAPEIGKKIDQLMKEWFKNEYKLGDVSISLKFEKFYKTILYSGKKKRYAGHCVWKGRDCDFLEIKGYDAIRGDQSEYTKKTQEYLLELIVRRKLDKDEVREKITKIIRNFREQPLVDIALKKGMDRPLDAYKVYPAHVRAAILANLNLGTDIKGGDQVQYLYVKEYNGHTSDVIAFEDPAAFKTLEIAWEKMIDVSLKAKLENILEDYGISWANVLGTPSLERWI